MRNGIVADTLRRAGSPFRIIFGLNLPQIVEIAAETGYNRELAESLWANSTTRESMLLAPMLVNPATFSREDARRWISTIPTAEVADIFCHRLLRHTEFGWELAEELTRHPGGDYDLYTGLRLGNNLVSKDPHRALVLAGEINHPLARQLKEEAKFILGEY